MFTGIIRQVGTVQQLRSTATGKRLTVDLGPLSEGCKIGDSVAVAGACLTLAQMDGTTAQFDVEAETLSRTTLGSARAGAKVNLERPLLVGDRFDGHIVQGHVDGLAEVRAVRRGGRYLVEFTASEELTAQMVPKGSAAVDGVSLTLVDVTDIGFSVALIPETLATTTLGGLHKGDKVNIEADILGKYVRRYVQQLTDKDAGGLSVDKLKQAGFM